MKREKQGGSNDEGNNARYRPGKEHLSAARRGRTRQGGAAKASYPQTAIAVGGEASSVSDRPGGVRGSASLGARVRTIWSHDEADERAFCSAVPEEPEE